MLERITNLLALLLETRRPLTLADIAAELTGQYPDNDSSRRTAFERDKALLRAEGVPIEQEVLGGDLAGQTAYWIDRRRYELGELGLDDAERQALQFAVAAVRMGTEWGTEAIWKLGSATVTPTGSRAVEFEAALPAMAGLPVLFQAASERAVVRFTYRGGERRVVRPYSLLARNGIWYLVGHDEVRGELRTFRADRIEGDVSAGAPDAFERPAGFDPRQAFPSDYKTLAIGEGVAESAQVFVDSQRAEQAERELGAGAVLERRDDGVVVEVPCTNLGSFRHWLFGWMEHAEVLGPPEVRAHITGWLREMVPS